MQSGSSAQMDFDDLAENITEDDETE